MWSLTDSRRVSNTTWLPCLARIDPIAVPYDPDPHTTIFVDRSTPLAFSWKHLAEARTKVCPLNLLNTFLPSI